MIKIIPLALCVFFLSGCIQLSNKEKVWQGAHFVDLFQTLSVANHPECFWEKDPMTRRLIGEHPKPRDVLLWAAITSVVHVFIWKGIDKKVPKKYHLREIDIAIKSRVVINNNRRGVRVYGNNNSDCDKQRREQSNSTVIHRF